MHASWLSACQPVPIRPRVRAPGLARCRAGSSGPQLAEPIGLDQGEQLGLVRGEERDHEPRALGKPDVGLDPGALELPVGGRHDVQPPGLQPEPAARLVLDDAPGDSREAGIHRLDGVGRSEELLDVGFAKVERHGAG